MLSVLRAPSRRAVALIALLGALALALTLALSGHGATGSSAYLYHASTPSHSDAYLYHAIEWG